MLPYGSPSAVHDHEKHAPTRSRPCRCHKRTSNDLHSSHTVRPPKPERDIRLTSSELSCESGSDCESGRTWWQALSPTLPQLAALSEVSELRRSGDDIVRRQGT